MRIHNALRRIVAAGSAVLVVALATAGSAAALSLPGDPLGTVVPTLCPVTGAVPTGDCVTGTGVTVPGTGVTVPGTGVTVPGTGITVPVTGDVGSGVTGVLPAGGSTAAGNTPSGGGSAVADTRRPRARLGARRARLTVSLHRGYTVTVACDEACSIAGQLSHAGRWSAIARGKARLNTPGKVKVKLRFTRAAKRALKSKRSVKVTIRVTVVDAAGNATKRTKRVTLRR
jgi:hypothetical protein